MNLDQEIVTSLMINFLPPKIKNELKKKCRVGEPLPSIREMESIQSNVKDEAWKKAEQEWEICQKEKIQILLAHAGPYPYRLKQIFSPPPIIYVMGNVFEFEQPAIALVGSRRCSLYGQKLAIRLAEELTEYGIVTISGLARGIDTHVHQATLHANGQTWAVIGSGMCELYPPENRDLARKIMESGSIITEFSLNQKPYPANFPQRNRIIAGLSLGTVVIEGGEKSGALITAKWALEEGREVYAVPGPITSPLSVAPHRLLRLGAKMVESAADIVEELPVEYGRRKNNQVTFGNESDNFCLHSKENLILEKIGGEPTPIEILRRNLEMSSSEVTSRLLEMELKGLIKTIPGGMVVKN